MSAAEALTAATRGAAAALGIDSAVGSIRPGLWADLLVVDGNPLDDPAIVGRRDALGLVVHNGLRVAGTRVGAGQP